MMRILKFLKLKREERRDRSLIITLKKNLKMML